MSNLKKITSQNTVWILSALVALVILGMGALVVKLLISDDAHKRQRQIQTVTLLKPPPPAKIKEKIPEPEVKEEEEKIIEPELEELPPDETDDQSQEETSTDDLLGLDADGTAGSDGFGLKAKKGGRALIGGSLGNDSLLKQYGWYARIIEEVINREVKKHFEQNGGIPKGALETVLKIALDERGRIAGYRIIDSSENGDMDEAVKEALELAVIDEPPPEGMPRGMKIKISSKG